MNALILAAGFGTRLGTYGEETPKGLIHVGKTTLIGRVMRDVKALGSSIDHIGVVTNEKFVNRFGMWLHGEVLPEVNFVSDGAQTPETRIGAIADILFACEKFGWSDDLLVLPSDTYYAFALADFVQFAKEKKEFTTVLRHVQTSLIRGRLGCGTVEGDRITSFVEKPENPPSDLAAIPLYYYPKEVLCMIPEYEKEGGNMDAPGSIIPWLLQKNIPVHAYITEKETLDVGTVDDIEKLKTIGV